MRRRAGGSLSFAVVWHIEHVEAERIAAVAGGRWVGRVTATDEGEASAAAVLGEGAGCRVSGIVVSSVVEGAGAVVSVVVGTRAAPVVEVVVQQLAVVQEEVAALSVPEKLTLWVCCWMSQRLSPWPRPPSASPAQP